MVACGVPVLLRTLKPVAKVFVPTSASLLMVSRGSLTFDPDVVDGPSALADTGMPAGVFESS